MATVLNRTTKHLIVSANTPDYPVAEWIIDPNLSAVTGFPSKYWTISGDVVSLLDQAGRDAIDLAELNAARDATAATMDAVENWMRAFALVVLDEFNAHTTNINAVAAAVKNASTYGAARTAMQAIATLPPRTIANLKTGVRNKLGT